MTDATSVALVKRHDLDQIVSFDDDIDGVDDARTVIDAMVEAGWYCAPPLYARTVQMLESLTD